MFMKGYYTQPSALLERLDDIEQKSTCSSIDEELQEMQNELDGIMKEHNIMVAEE